MKGNIVKKSKPVELELIASGETTEEVNSIVITTDNDGNPFELCDVVNIYAYCPIATNSANSALTYDFNNALVQQSPGTGVNTTSEQYHRLLGIYTGRKWDTYCYAVNHPSVNANIFSRDRHTSKDNPVITNIKLHLFNSPYVLPVGFKYEIYGRRA